MSSIGEYLKFITKPESNHKKGTFPDTDSSKD